MLAPADNHALSNFALQLQTSKDDVAADAQAALAQAIVDGLVQIPAKAVREGVFLYEYLGPEQATLFLNNWRVFKKMQTPHALKRLIEAVKALSLSEFMRGVNLNLGQK